MYDSESWHGSTQYQGNHSNANGILYTRFMDLYSSLTYITLWVPQAVYTKYEEPWRCFQPMYDFKNAHGIAPPQRAHYDTNDIFVYPLYGFVQLRDIRRCTTK